MTPYWQIVQTLSVTHENDKKPIIKFCIMYILGIGLTIGGSMLTAAMPKAIKTIKAKGTLRFM